MNKTILPPKIRGGEHQLTAPKSSRQSRNYHIGKVKKIVQQPQPQPLL